MMIRLAVLACLALVVLALGSARALQTEAPPSACGPVSHAGADYTVCTLPLDAFELELHLNRPGGAPWGQLSALEAALKANGTPAVLLTNGGMYHSDLRPVGLYIEAGETLAPLVTGDGPGNFQLLPNGVFWIEAGTAGIEETEAYAATGRAPDYATQSGPMLVIGGQLHPAFREASDSRFRRSGLGVSQDGRTVTLAISEAPVNFHDFATLFRDTLGIDNALYIDGKVCRLNLPAEGRREPGLNMGPILVARPRPADPAHP